MDFADFLNVIRNLNINFSEEEMKILKLNYENEKNKCRVHLFLEHLFTINNSINFAGHLFFISN